MENSDDASPPAVKKKHLVPEDDFVERYVEDIEEGELTNSGIH